MLFFHWDVDNLVVLGCKLFLSFILIRKNRMVKDRDFFVATWWYPKIGRKIWILIILALLFYGVAGRLAECKIYLSRLILDFVVKNNIWDRPNSFLNLRFLWINKNRIPFLAKIHKKPKPCCYLIIVPRLHLVEFEPIWAIVLYITILV